ncbi:hypothetical protein KSC_090940 [Ktedonobacter sp. SOSP1-52]|nr:hypothetical protein KSC_090940 [Ktedonobacter sp. SOSP1-52]
MQTIDVKGARLSPQQSRLWSWTQDKPWSRVQCAIEITGYFEPAVFQQALQYVVDRHEILRTAFVQVPGVELPMQAISSYSKVSCPLIDLQHISSKNQQIFQDEHWRALLQHPFDLEHGPLLYAEVLRLSPQSHILLLTVHALCADAPALKQLSTAIFENYAARLDNRGEGEEEEPLQYTNVSAWLNELLQDDEAEEQLAYWRKLDLSQLGNLSLPFQRSEKNIYQNWSLSAPTLSKPQEHDILLSEDVQRQIQLLAQRFNVTTEVILLASWHTLLWRLTGDQELVLGLSCDGRPYEELVDLIGPYARMVPLSISLTNQRSFAWVLTQMQQLYQQALEKQLYFTWEALSSNTPAQRSFPLSFAYESQPEPAIYGPLAVTWPRQEEWGEPFQLQLRAQQTKASLQLQLAYNPSLFSGEQIQRLAGLLLQCISSVAEQPEAALSSLALLTPLEQVTQQERWQGQQRDWPFVPLHQRFQAQVQRQPAAPALRFGTVLLSYQEVEQVTNQLANLLLSHGVLPGQRIALYQRRDQWAIISILAVLKAGGCYVPLDEDLPPSRVRLLLGQIAPAAIIYSRELQEQIVSLDDNPAVTIQVESLPAILEDQPASPPEVAIQPQQVASVIYTSGSTGSPKGVQISQQSISNYTQALCDLLEVQSGWHFATVSSLAADLGNTSIFCALASGGCLHLLPYTLVTDGAAFASYARSHALDVLKIVPTHLQALLATGASGIIPRQRLILGGEALPWTLVEQLKHSPDAPQTCRLYNHYGPTETTIGAMVNPLGLLYQVYIPDPQDRAYSVPIGHPISNVHVAIWDDERHAVPQGCKGELYIAGEGVSLGYLNAPDETAERFLISEQTRWYRTGDVVRENEEGLIEFIGRQDAQIKLRGYRIEPSEIEEHLRNLPTVREAVVQLRTDGPDELEGDPYLVGYIIPWKQPGPDQQSVCEALNQQLPSYLVPRYIVCLEQFPLSPNGKLDRRRLPAPSAESGGKTRVEPIEDVRTPVEAMVQQIWRHVLDVREIGRSDDFFQLGGHSLLGTRLIAQMRTAFGVEVPITWLFETPTVAGLALRIEEALRQGHGVALPPLVPAARDHRLPLSFAQQRLWFLDQLEPGSSTYTIPREMRLRGKLDRRALWQALHEVILRHENLRTTFPSQQGEPWQQISPQPSPRWPWWICASCHRRRAPSRLGSSPSRRRPIPSIWPGDPCCAAGCSNWPQRSRSSCSPYTTSSPMAGPVADSSKS